MKYAEINVKKTGIYHKQNKIKDLEEKITKWKGRGEYVAYKKHLFWVINS